MRAELGEKVMAYVDDDMWKRLIRGGACFPKNREKETADLIRRTVDWRRDLRVDTVRLTGFWSCTLLRWRTRCTLDQLALPPAPGAILPVLCRSYMLP